MFEKQKQTKLLSNHTSYESSSVNFCERNFDKVTILANFHDIVVRTVHWLLAHAKDIKATIVSVSYEAEFSWFWKDVMLKHGIWQFLPDTQFANLARLGFWDSPGEDPMDEQSGSHQVARLRRDVRWIEIQY